LQMHDRTLKYVFLAFCAIAVIFPLLNVYYIFPAFESVAVELAESEAAGMVRHMSHMVTIDGKLLPPGDMDPIVRGFVRDSQQISGIKVYSAPAVVIYSYPPGSEGGVIRKAGFWETLQSGKEYSKLKKRGMRTEEGIQLETDVLEVYIPIIHSGFFYGAFEVYYDLSHEVSQVKSTVYKVSAVMLVVAMLAFVIVTFIVLRGSADQKKERIERQMNIRSPTYHIFMISVSIFSAEMLVMLFLPVLPEMSRLGEALFDAFVLLVVVSPLMYYLIFRPLSWALTRLETSEAKLKGLLDEKEGMMRDMVWRVHGNLSMVSSMLSLHSRKLEDPAAQEAVLESQGRIRSMVLVYELLHGSMDPGGVKAREFFDSLSVRIMRGLNVDANKVRLMLEVDDIHLDVDSMVACGLILNELLSNSVRHAFPGERAGEVMVSLKSFPELEGGAVLSVSDNGVGVPEGFDFSKDGGLGLTIVRGLAAQIGGELQCDCQAGAKVAVVFSTGEPSG
jgi:two-component sensor histidine kinase